MRGVAALFVAAFHLQQKLHGNAFSGYLAVDLFFALSGFVIALNYTDRFANNLTAVRFMQFRLIRLFPLYILGHAIALAMLAMGYTLQMEPDASSGAVACAVLFGAVMLPDPCSSILFPLNGPAWSLFFELAINLAFGLALWRSSLPLLAALMAVSAFFFLFLFGPPDYFNVGWGWKNFVGGMMRTVFSFCAGVALFRILPFGWRRQGYASLLPILGMAAVIGPVVSETYRIQFEILAVVLILPALLFLGCMLEPPNRAVQRIFGFLGGLSYPIYAIHWPLLAITVPVTAVLRLPASLSIALFLIVLVPVAYGAARLDGIVRRRLSEALKRRRAARLQLL